MFDKTNSKRKTHPRERANILSILTYFYTLGSFYKGFKKDWSEENLYNIVKKCKASRLGNKADKLWAEESKKPNPSLVKLFFRLFGLEYATLGACQLFIKSSLMLAQPQLVGKVIKYFTPGQTEMSRNEAIFWTSLLVLVSILNCFYVHTYMFFIQQLGLKIRVALSSLIYRKALKLSPESLQKITNGRIVILITKDVYSFDITITFLHDVWIGVIQIILMSVVMYYRIGWSCLTGVGFLILTVPIQIFLGRLVQNTKLKSSARADERIRAIQEILTSIKTIKMYVWEKFFGERVNYLRKVEVGKMRIIYYLKTFMFSLGAFSTRLSFYLAIVMYVMFENKLTAEKAFVVMGCYNSLRTVISISLPIGLAYIAEASTAVKRITDVMVAKEANKTEYKQSKSMIQVRDATVTIGDKNILENVSLHMESGLIGITGNIVVRILTDQKTKFPILTDIGLGSGKSTLLKLILQEANIAKGSTTTKGVVSYASQEPWLFPSTIKQNIIFGEEYDQKRYQEVVKICALRTDLENFPRGDETIVMDKGSNLSKGQQTRINLARAIYRKADIYLLDDCLSSLDAYVGRFVFNKVIKEFLKDKLVLFVSHQKYFLKETDKLIVLNSGRIETVGTADELEKIKLDIVENVHNDEENKAGGEAGKGDAEESTLIEKKKVGIYHEEKKEGGVNFETYKTYMNAAGGWVIVVLIVLVFLVAQVCSSWFDYYISQWVDIESKVSLMEMTNQTNTTEYMKSKEFSDKSVYYYTALVSASTIFLLSQATMLFYFTMRASVKLHKTVFGNVIQAGMEFFDFYLSGNILNRFSKDVTLIDDVLPLVIFEVIKMLFIIGGIIVLVSMTNPYFLIVAVIFACILYLMKLVYSPTGRSLMRVENATRSPLVGQLNASLEGLATIRANEAQEILKVQFDNCQDVHSSSSYMGLTATRAFGFYLDMLSSTFIGIVAFSFIFFDTSAMAGKVGLALTQSFGLTGVLQWGIRQWAHLENLMTSVERLTEYSSAKEESKAGDSPRNWPGTGRVEFKNVNLTYIKSEEPILKNLNFTINNQEKLAIVGRTGAGKSSIISVLFKLYKVAGQILIDGIDIKTINVEYLRKKIAFIPQDPILFSGTMRTNLDPNDEYDDANLWSALEDIGMKRAVSNLGMEIKEGGANFSAGQRQLICLARAILRNTKILILDEATANVDSDTETFMQETIMRKFSNCTIISIVHKLSHVLSSDKVMVLDKGQVQEFDDPRVLLKNKQGTFYGMFKQAGLLNEDKDKDL